MGRILLLGLLFILLPGVAAGERGIVPILCVNGDKQLPGEGPTFQNYSKALAEIISNDASLNLEPIVVGSLGEFVEYLAFPQTHLGIVSLYRASVPAELQRAMIELFDRGVGLIGINEIAYSGNVSRTILPSFANATSTGRLALIGGKFRKGHDFIKSEASHPITQGLPDQMFLSDVDLYYCNLVGEPKAVDPPKPSEGTLTVLYRVKDAKSGYADGMIPAITAYENVGRSVTLPAFALTERGGPEDYTGVVYDPNFQALLRNSIRWVSEAGSRSAQKRMDEMKSEIDEHLLRRSELSKEASQWKKKSSQKRLLRLGVLTALGVAAIGIVYRYTFMVPEKREQSQQQ